MLLKLLLGLAAEIKQNLQQLGYEAANDENIN